MYYATSQVTLKAFYAFFFAFSIAPYIIFKLGLTCDSQSLARNSQWQKGTAWNYVNFINHPVEPPFNSTEEVFSLCPFPLEVLRWSDGQSVTICHVVFDLETSARGEWKAGIPDQLLRMKTPPETKTKYMLISYAAGVATPKIPLKVESRMREYKTHHSRG